MLPFLFFSREVRSLSETDFLIVDWWREERCRGSTGRSESPGPLEFAPMFRYRELLLAVGSFCCMRELLLAVASFCSLSRACSVFASVCCIRELLLAVASFCCSLEVGICGSRRRINLGATKLNSAEGWVPQNLSEDKVGRHKT